MRTITAAIAALAFGLATANDFLGERNLQSIPPPAPPPSPPAVTYTSTTKALKYYGDDIKVAYRATLGCGACITGGYTYCVLGKQGDDYSSKTVTQTCCANTTA